MRNCMVARRLRSRPCEIVRPWDYRRRALIGHQPSARTSAITSAWIDPRQLVHVVPCESFTCSFPEGCLRVTTTSTSLLRGSTGDGVYTGPYGRCDIGKVTILSSGTGTSMNINFHISLWYQKRWGIGSYFKDKLIFILLMNKSNILNSLKKICKKHNNVK